MAHELEGGAEKHLRYRRGRRRTVERAEDAAEAPALIEHEPDDGAEDGAPGASGHQQTDQSPKKCAFPSHSR